MLEIIATDQIIIGIAIGVVFDDLGKRVVASRLGTTVDETEAEDETQSDGDNTSAHAKAVDHFDPTKAGGADDEKAE